MKQSKKLLSLVLAMLMVFSCFTVAVNAAPAKSAIAYDSIDNAALTAEQAADILLDYVDKILPADELDLSVLGTLHLDTLNQLIPDVYSLLNNGILALAGGDVASLRNQRSILKNWNRTGNNIGAVETLLKFLATSDVVGVLKKAPYGLLTDNGIKANGLITGIVKGLVDLGDINDILMDLPGFATRAVFDALLYASYNYPQNSEDLNNTLPTNANNIDKILNMAAFNLLTTPQDSSWKKVTDTDVNGKTYGSYTTAEGKGVLSEDGKQVKIWDMNSIVSTLFKASGKTVSDIDLTTHSFFEILDTLLPYAYDEFGIHGLNHTLKKTIMEAMGVDFVETTFDKLPAGAQSAFGTDVVASYCNYAMKDLMWKDASTGYWYYTDVRSRAIDLDKDGVDDVDEDGNVIKEKTRVYYAANVTTGNDLVNLMNWDYAFDGTSFGTADSASGISSTISTYGSVFGSLNHLLFLIFDIAGNDAVITKSGNTIVDVTNGNAVVWEDGDSSKLNANLLKAVRFTLNHYSVTIFGKGNAYVDKNGVVDAAFLAEVNNAGNDLIDLAAYIGLPLFNDAMPQLIMPKDANGKFAFHDGVQVFELGAVVLREFMTDITPALNYDDAVFAAGTLTSASGRQFASHSADEWYNIILNMGLDIAFTFLSGYTNFNKAIPAAGTDNARWMGMLDQIVEWAVKYVGAKGASSSAFKGLDWTTVSAKGNAFAKLDYCLNTILPLGFVTNCSGNGYDFDLEALFLKIKAIASDLDIAGLLSILGRNTAATDSAKPNGVAMGNILNNRNLVKQILDLANRILYVVFGKNLLPATTNCATLLTSANIGTLIQNLITGLYDRSDDILRNVLPVVIQFLPEFGGEQALGTPEISLNSTIDCSNGALTGSFKVANGSKGIWRGYTDPANGQRKQDNQYTYKITGVKAYDFNGANSSKVSIGSYTTTAIDFGGEGTVNYTVSGVPAEGAIVRFAISYTVSDEDGAAMAGGKVFTINKYCYLSYNKTDARQELLCTDERDIKPYVYSPFYVDMSAGADIIPELTTYKLKNTNGTAGRTGSLVSQNTSAVNGITLSSWGGTSKSSGISVSKDSSETHNGFTVNAATYNSAVSAGTIKAGKTLTWAVKGYGFAGLGTGSDNGTQNIVLKFYDASYLNKLKSLVSDETNKMRLAEDYNITGTVYAGSVLETAANEDGLVETAFATTGIDPDGDPDTQVTVIDCATAWASYQSALQAAIRGAWQEWNGNSVFNHEALYKALYTASKDVNYLKKTAEQAAGSADNIDAAVVALDAQIKSTNAALEGDNRDYKAYRWERFITARSDARSIVSAYNLQNYNVPDDQYFPYNSSLDEAKLKYVADKTPYAKYIEALKESYTAEEMEAREKALDNAKVKYANIDALDVAEASNLLTRTSYRLLKDNENAELGFINSEIASAKAIYGTTNTVYSARSWAAYTSALSAAEAAAADGNNKTRFDAKYELQVAVNNLRKDADEADYEELEALMAQAEVVLANAASYNNTDKEIGKVLAALGYTEIKNAENENVQLFPNSALIVDGKSYAADDQRKVDRASDALREALAKLKFAGVTVNGTTSDVIGKDKDDNDISVVTSHIAKNLTAAKAGDLFTVSGAEEKKVSTNGTYALTAIDENDVLTGTGSTITFYKTVSGVKVPMATVTVVVDGDVNGDGAVDVLDATVVELVTNNHAELSGIYFVAGNVDTASEEIVANDYNGVVNIALS